MYFAFALGASNLLVSSASKVSCLGATHVSRAPMGYPMSRGFSSFQGIVLLQQDKTVDGRNLAPHPKYPKQGQLPCLGMLRDASFLVYGILSCFVTHCFLRIVLLSIWNVGYVEIFWSYWASLCSTNLGEF